MVSPLVVVEGFPVLVGELGGMTAIAHVGIGDVEAFTLNPSGKAKSSALDGHGSNG